MKNDLAKQFTEWTFFSIETCSRYWKTLVFFLLGISIVGIRFESSELFWRENFCMELTKLLLNYISLDKYFIFLKNSFLNNDGCLLMLIFWKLIIIDVYVNN